MNEEKNFEENFALAIAKLEDERFSRNIEVYSLHDEFSLNMEDENISTKIHNTLQGIWTEGTVELFIKNKILSDKLEVKDLVAFDSARFSRLVLEALNLQLFTEKEAWGLLFLNASRVQDAFESAKEFKTSYFKGTLFYEILFKSEEEDRAEKIHTFDNLVEELQISSKVEIIWLDNELFEKFSIVDNFQNSLESETLVPNKTRLKPSVPSNSKLTLIYEHLAKEDKSELWDYLNSLTGKERNEILPQLYINKKENTAILTAEDYLELPALYPRVSYSHYLRGVYFYHYAWEARGLGITNTVGQKNYALFYERLRYARSDLKKAYELSSNEQTYWAELYNLVKHFKNKESDTLEDELYVLIQEHAMQNPFCIERVTHMKKARWGGSHKESLNWAREVVSSSSQGDSIRVIIFEVLIEQYKYILEYDRNEEKANAIFQELALQNEVNEYFEELLERSDEVRSTLLFWYEKVGDEVRVNKLKNTMN